MDLYKFGVKIFVSNPGAVSLRDFIPVFQSWIQKQNVEGHLLIDVHDYSHVPDGPGILLVAQEGNFSMDQEGGRLGLFYYRKRPLDGNMQANLRSVVKTALQACKLLEAEPKLKDIKFRTDEILVLANDRLLAPNTPEALAGFQPVVTAALGEIFKGAPIKLSPSSKDSRERLGVLARVG
jgi:hypothetical protein